MLHESFAVKPCSDVLRSLWGQRMGCGGGGQGEDWRRAALGGWLGGWVCADEGTEECGVRFLSKAG